MLSYHESSKKSASFWLSDKQNNRLHCALLCCVHKGIVNYPPSRKYHTVQQLGWKIRGQSLGSHVYVDIHPNPLWAMNSFILFRAAASMVEPFQRNTDSVALSSMCTDNLNHLALKCCPLHLPKESLVVGLFFF